MTASKDGMLILWSLQSMKDEDMLKFDSDLDLQTPITKVKWLSSSVLLAATTEGDLLQINVKLDS